MYWPFACSRVGVLTSAPHCLAFSASPPGQYSLNEWFVASSSALTVAVWAVRLVRRLAREACGVGQEPQLRGPGVFAA